MQTRLYREQHRILRELVGAMPSTPEAVDSLHDHALLMKINGTLRAHLSMEDQYLYPDMLKHANSIVSSRAKLFQSEMGGLASSFAEFYQKWLDSHAIERDKGAFVSEWSVILTALANRMDREDTELYDFVDDNVELTQPTT